MFVNFIEKSSWNVWFWYQYVEREVREFQEKECLWKFLPLITREDYNKITLWGFYRPYPNHFWRFRGKVRDWRIREEESRSYSLSPLPLTFLSPPLPIPPSGWQGQMGCDGVTIVTFRVWVPVGMRVRLVFFLYPKVKSERRDSGSREGLSFFGLWGDRLLGELRVHIFGRKPHSETTLQF